MSYTTWTKIKWDGNPELNLWCWRKSFGLGHVSVGIGGFLHIVYSYGSNSESSLASTRWRKGRPNLTEKEAMALVDVNNGHYQN